MKRVKTISVFLALVLLFAGCEEKTNKKDAAQTPVAELQISSVSADKLTMQLREDVNDSLRSEIDRACGGIGGAIVVNSIPDANVTLDTFVVCNKPADFFTTKLSTSTDINASAPGEYTSILSIAAFAGDDNECPAGGISISGGADIDSNEMLDDNEALDVTHMCNELSGLNALISIRRLSSADTLCENGGIEILNGFDNGDGWGIPDNNILENGEIDTGSIVCNGTDGVIGSDGANAMADVAVIESGDTVCSNGGQLLQTGTDANRNEVLDDEEIASESKICNSNLTDYSNAISFGGEWDPASGAYPTPAVVGSWYNINPAGVFESVEYNLYDAILYDGAAWRKVNNYEYGNLINDLNMTLSDMLAANSDAITAISLAISDVNATLLTMITINNNKIVDINSTVAVLIQTVSDLNLSLSGLISTNSADIAVLSTAIGSLEDLNTADKTNLIGATNELLSSLISLSANVGDITDLNTTDKTSTVNAINELIVTVYNLNVSLSSDIASTNSTIGTLSDLNTTEQSSIVSSINEVTDDMAAISASIDSLNSAIGTLADLNTTDKTNLVASINEVAAGIAVANVSISALSASVSSIETRLDSFIDSSYGTDYAITGSIHKTAFSDFYTFDGITTNTISLASDKVYFKTLGQVVTVAAQDIVFPAAPQAAVESTATTSSGYSFGDFIVDSSSGNGAAMYTYWCYTDAPAGTLLTDTNYFTKVENAIRYDNLLLRDDGVYYITQTTENQFTDMDTMLDYTSELYSTDTGADTGSSVMLTYDVANEQYSGSDGHIYKTVGATARYNAGAYYPFLNPFGSADFSDGQDWITTTNAKDSTAALFENAGSGDGRLDGHKQDIIYSNVFIDQRFSAEWQDSGKHVVSAEMDKDIAATQRADFVGSPAKGVEWYIQTTGDGTSLVDTIEVNNGAKYVIGDWVQMIDLNDFEYRFTVKEISGNTLTVATPFLKSLATGSYAIVSGGRFSFRYGGAIMPQLEIVNKSTNLPTDLYTSMDGHGPAAVSFLGKSENKPYYDVYNSNQTDSIALSHRAIAEDASAITTVRHLTDAYSSYNETYSQDANIVNLYFSGSRGYFIHYMTYTNSLLPISNRRVIDGTEGISDVFASSGSLNQNIGVVLGSSFLNKVSTGGESGAYAIKKTNAYIDFTTGGLSKTQSMSPSHEQIDIAGLGAESISGKHYKLVNRHLFDGGGNYDVYIDGVYIDTVQNTCSTYPQIGDFIFENCFDADGNGVASFWPVDGGFVAEDLQKYQFDFSGWTVEADGNWYYLTIWDQTWSTEWFYARYDTSFQLISLTDTYTPYNTATGVATGYSYLPVDSPAYKTVSYLTETNSSRNALSYIFKELTYELANTAAGVFIYQNGIERTWRKGELAKIKDCNGTLEGNILQYVGADGNTTSFDMPLWSLSSKNKILDKTHTDISDTFKLWDGDAFGDDNTFTIVDGISTVIDDNNNSVLVGQKARLLDRRFREYQ